MELKNLNEFNRYSSRKNIRVTKKSATIFSKKLENKNEKVKKLNYDFIEFFTERKLNKKNPIWSNKGIKIYLTLQKNMI